MAFQHCFDEKNKNNSQIIPRTLIITQRYILLCSEELFGDVNLSNIDYFKLKDINKIQLDIRDTSCLTIYSKSNKIFSSKSNKWRISTDSKALTCKMLEELRRHCTYIST